MQNYKFLEGLLNWYFGPQVEVSYRLLSGQTDLISPSVTINGEVVSRGRIRADEIVKYIEGLGAKRLDS